jgi:DNA polymerase III subunit delta'
MSREAEDDEDDVAAPRAATSFFGHREAERLLLAAYQSVKPPHAFLLLGPKGIGKATLAYRMARFVLSHPDPAAAEVRAAASLAVDPEHTAARRMTAKAHPGLLALERTPNEKGVMRQQIAVDDVRRTVTFFGNTSGEGGWRIALVDAVDELNRFGANALLKVLEEPPSRALLLLVCHSPARVLPTLRSRCCVVNMRPLAQADVASALAAAVGRDAGDADIHTASAAGDGSVGRALEFLDEDMLSLRRHALNELDRLPTIDTKALHELGEALAGMDARPLGAFLDTVNAWMARRLGRGSGDLAALARLAGAWQSINQAARDALEYNLERKPLVFSVFGLLADATRG